MFSPCEIENQRRIRDGHIPDGWSAESWSARLRQLASACDGIDPQAGRDYREWADNVDKRGGHRSAGVQFVGMPDIDPFLGAVTERF